MSGRVMSTRRITSESWGLAATERDQLLASAIAAG
jgi:hypothetical protein